MCAIAELIAYYWDSHTHIFLPFNMVVIHAIGTNQSKHMHYRAIYDGCGQTNTCACAAWAVVRCPQRLLFCFPCGQWYNIACCPASGEGRERAIPRKRRAIRNRSGKFAKRQSGRAKSVRRMWFLVPSRRFTIINSQVQDPQKDIHLLDNTSSEEGSRL
jgi:hypothetical protein